MSVLNRLHTKIKWPKNVKFDLMVALQLRNVHRNLILLHSKTARVVSAQINFVSLLLLLLLLAEGAIDDSMLLMMFWVLTGLSVLGLFSQRYGLQPLTLALIIRSIYHLGIGNTLILLGSLNVSRTTLPIHHLGS